MKKLENYPLVSDYPGEHTRNDSFARTLFDEDGIIVVEYKHNEIGKQYVPVTIALYALSSYNAHLKTGDEKNLKDFIKHSEWLINNFVDKGDWGVWYYNFDFKSSGCDCRKPWVSSMMQGLGASVLLRYNAVMGNELALDISNKALHTYNISIAEGGVLRVDEKKFRWYEEYPCPEMSSALNGFIFALVGTWEYHECLPDKKILQLFDSGIETLKSNLDRFELKLPLMRWTRYDDGFIIHSGKDYHNLHIKQLKLMHQFTGQKVFLERYEKWEMWETKYGDSVLFRPYQLICRFYEKIASKLHRRGRR